MSKKLTTVADLIAALSKYPADSVVLTNEYKDDSMAFAAIKLDQMSEEEVYLDEEGGDYGQDNEDGEELRKNCPEKKFTKHRVVNLFS